jgi:hypothetical protein
MTRDAIIRATQTGFEEFFGVWSINMERKGMGVLVFVSGDDAATQEGIDFAYLTLGELRDYLSRFSDKNGFVYRWVKHAESVRGIPLVIIPPAGGGIRKPSLSSVGVRWVGLPVHKAVDNPITALNTPAL